MSLEEAHEQPVRGRARGGRGREALNDLREGGGEMVDT